MKHFVCRNILTVLAYSHTEHNTLCTVKTKAKFNNTQQLLLSTANSLLNNTAK